jgi:predicted amidophosphoribosyltransferase
MRERGYNQVSFLALPLALALGIPYKPKGLTRIHETNTQVNLSASERLRNVMGAFIADSSIVENKTVLVIDDVATTGSTISACTEALVDAGAKEVYGLTLARAINRRI